MPTKLPKPRLPVKAVSAAKGKTEMAKLMMKQAEAKTPAKKKG